MPPFLPLLPRGDLLDMGCSILLTANAATRAAIRGSQTVLAGLRDAGSLDPARNELAPVTRQRLVRRCEFNDLGKRSQAD